MSILTEILAGRISKWDPKTESPVGMIAPGNGSACVRGPSRLRAAHMASGGEPIDSGRAIKRLERPAGFERWF